MRATGGNDPDPDPTGASVTSVPSYPAGAARERIGTCCSGGGIRSAAFDLGTLQALAADGILARARYLAAVSGGSYIASAFATAARCSPPEALAAGPLFAAGSPEEHHVRNHCSYLAPGALGKVHLAATVVVGVVGVVANVVFLAVLLFALRPVGWVIGGWQPPPGAAGAGVPLTGAGALVGVAVVAAAAGLLVVEAARVLHPRWGVRTVLGWVAVAAVVAASVAALTVAVLWVWGPLATTSGAAGAPALDVAADAIGVLPVGGDGAGQDAGERRGLGLLAVFGVVASTALFATQLTVAARRALTLGGPALSVVRRFPRLVGAARHAVVTVVGGVVVPLGLLAAFALVLGHAARAGVPPDAAELVRWTAVVAVVAVVAGFLRFSDVTSWSLHPSCKRRLPTAFAVQRYVDHGEVKAREVPYEQVLDLTGYSAAAMVDDAWEGAAVHDAPGIAVPFPELLVCAAANDSVPGATPPGTGVTGFVYSPGTVGGPLIGEMATPDYVAMVGGRRRLDATLPAAVAMSGAAVAPAMGRMMLAPLRLALALANVRLGVWMPSPRRGRHPWGTGRRRAGLAAANPSPVRLLWEALGRHPLESRYVYVTGGGHHENLGLVELVRRRCSTVFCFDAAGGPHDRYATLADAIAVARAVDGTGWGPSPTVAPAPTSQTASIRRPHVRWRPRRFAHLRGGR